jgi:biopolymer transport protein ExbD
MAEIIANESGGKHKGKKRAKKHSTHIDMTPMVDLACLLLTFFMLTTQFNKPKVMEIIMPDPNQEIDDNRPQVAKDRALNIILVEDNKILWYNGLADPTEASLPTLYETDFSDDGIRKILLQRNRNLFTQIETLNEDVITGKIELPQDSIQERIRNYKRADKNSPVVLIKAGENVKYKDMVDIIDEMAITNIASYAIVDINNVEKKMVSDYFKARASGAASNK